MNEQGLKLLAIKIKYSNGTFSERIPIKSLAQNVNWDSSHNLVDILGNVNLNIPIQTQLNNKVSIGSLNNYIENRLDEKATEYLTEHYTSNVLKTTDLQNGTTQSNRQSQVITNQLYRQYAIQLDTLNKLSVNVPWTDTIFQPIGYIYGGTCSSASNNLEKEIILDNTEDFNLAAGTIIAIYFTNNNTVKANTTDTLKLKLSNTSDITPKPIYYFSQFDNQGNDEIEVINADTPEYIYKFSSGLKFFTYYTGGDTPGWLMTSPDNALISYLLNNTAKSENAALTGTPTAPTPADSTNSTQVATTAFVKNVSLLKSDLADVSQSAYQAQTSTTAGRQYAVMRDSEGHLSVNVPWTTSDADAMVQKIWTGTCSTSASTMLKEITLDVLDDSDFEVVHGTTLMIYFTVGNTAENPKLSINNGNFSSVLYQNGTVLKELQDEIPYKNWGPGLKIFTYYSALNETAGWVMQSADFSAIKYLTENKADINSPHFTGHPTAPTPVAANEIANMGYVQSAIENAAQASAESISTDFDNTKIYSIGDYVYYDGKLYRFVQTHAAGDWSRSDVEQVSITGDIQSTNQKLQSILVDNGISTTCQNLGVLGTHFNDNSGFIRTVNQSNLLQYQYSYSSSNMTPYIRMNNSFGEGHWLIGFKLQWYANPVAGPDYPYYQASVSVSNAGSQNVSMGWKQISFYTTNLSEIKFIYYRDQNFDYGSNSIATVTIKDFYIYNLDEEIANNEDFKNYIISQQNRNYQSGTITYSIPNYGTDKTLSQEGAAADAKVVGDIFNEVLLNPLVHSYTFTNLAPIENFTNLVQVYNISDHERQFYESKTVDGSPVVTKICKINKNIQKNTTIMFGFNAVASVLTQDINLVQDPVTRIILHFSKNGEDIRATSEIVFNNYQNFSNMYKINDDIDQIYFTVQTNFYPNESCQMSRTVTIKNLYIYDVSSLDEERYHVYNYIVNQQKNTDTYQNDTVEYVFPKTDYQLTRKGKAADAKTVGDVFNRVFVKTNDEYTTDTSLSETGKAADAAAVGEYFANVLNAPDVSRATFTSLGDTYGDLTINESAWYAITNGSADGMVSIVYWFSDEELYLPVVAGAKMTPWIYLEAGATGYKYTSAVNTSHLVKAPNLKII